MTHPLAGKSPDNPLSAAVPNATWQVIQSMADDTPVPVGHAFELYCPYWSGRPYFNTTNNKSSPLLQAVCKCPPHRTLNEALSQRNQHLSLASSGSDFLTLPLQLISPLLTGSGIEHVSENGFSFIRPYGLPYLPGSGVKGSLRAAAEYLALFEPDSGWRMVDVWWLFGWEPGANYWCAPPVHEEFDGHSTAFRERIKSMQDDEAESIDEFLNQAAALTDGADQVRNWLAGASTATTPEQISFRGMLDFWDMHLLDAKASLDIMTPHYTNYYNGTEPPIDGNDDKTGSNPVPIPFLVIAPGASARLSIQWTWRPELQSIKSLQQLHANWRSRLHELVVQTVKWQGFGAKTAVGYGRFRIDTNAVEDDTRYVDKQRADAEEAENKARTEHLKLTLSEEQFEIHQLRQLLDAPKEQVEAELKRVVELAAENWPENARLELKQLAVEIHKKHPVSSKRPKQRRKELLQKL